MTLRQIVLPCILIAILGLAALAALIYYTAPTAATILLALMLTGLSTAAATAPLLGRIQQKIEPKTPAAILPRLAIRQGIWAGLYAIFILILHLQKLLDPIFAIVLLVIFILLENFLQTRTEPAPPTRPRPRKTRTATRKSTKAAFQSTRKRKPKSPRK